MRSKSQSLAVDGASTSTSSQSLSATESSSTSMMILLFFHQMKLLVMQYQFPRKTHMILVQAMVSIFSKASSANDAGEA